MLPAETMPWGKREGLQLIKERNQSQVIVATAVYAAPIQGYMDSAAPFSQIPQTRVGSVLVEANIDASITDLSLPIHCPGYIIITKEAQR